MSLGVFGILSGRVLMWLALPGWGIRDCCELGSPVVHVGANDGCSPRVGGEVVVGEPVNGGEHVDEDLPVEAGVVLGGPFEQPVAAITLGEVVDVGEIPALPASE